MGLFDRFREPPLPADRAKLLGEFSFALSAVVLQVCMFNEVAQLHPNYGQSFLERLDAAIDVASWRMGDRENLTEEELENPEIVPLNGLDGSELGKFDAWELADLRTALRPVERAEAIEHEWLYCCALAVAIHSALESLCKGLQLPGHSLPAKLAPWVADPAQLDVIRDLDATRHIVVHNRGLVDDRFLTNAPAQHLLRGERRPLDTDRLMAWLRTVDRVGRHMLRSAT